jgi:PAS domain S-box-containing protein
MATILIIDDRPSNREFLLTLLGYKGHRLVEAADGAEGLAVARAEHPDLIITDILMPTMDGYEFVRRLHADPAFTHIPVIFWSAHYLEREARTLAHACGVSHLLMKPCDPEEVLRTVQTALDHASTPATAPPEEFDREHLRLITDKLSQKVEELRMANLKLDAVVETGRRLALERDLLRLLDNCCRAARDIIGAQWVVIGILDDAGPTLRHFSTSGLAPEITALIGTAQPHQGVFNELLHSRSVCRLHDVGGDPHALGFPLSCPPIHTFLGAAISSPLRVYGCLALANKLGADAFSEDDERLATTLAAQLAVAYENARLYTELEQRAAELGQEVAEHQLAEEQLRRAEAQYRTLVEYIPAITYTTTLEPFWRTLYISPQVETILGFSPAEWTADPQFWAKRLHPDDRERVLAMLAHSHTIGTPFRAEYRMLTRHGHEVWLHNEGLVVKDEIRGPLFFQGIMLDMTRRKRTEEALVERARLAALVAEVGVALTTDASLRDVLQRCTEALVRHLEAAFARIWTLHQDENILTLQASAGMYTHIDGAHSRVPVGPSKIGLIAQERQPHLTNAVAGDPRVHDQVWARREGMVAFAGHPLLVAEKVVGVMAMFARTPLGDATIEALAAVADQIALGIERKRAEEALRDSEERYRDLFENANDIIYAYDLAGNFTSFNHMGEQITGYTRAEALRMNLSALVAPEQLALVYEMMAHTMAGTPAPTYELAIVTKSGHRVTLEVRSRLLSRAGQPVGVQSIVRDVTERHRLEAQLRQAQKMEAVGTLAGGIAHDFNNILGAILGYTDLALDTIPPDSQTRRDLQQVLAASVRAKELVQHILTFSRRTEQERQPVQLHLLVKEVLSLLRAALPATITLRYTLDNRAGRVLADSTQIHQVLLNLCTNAAHAMRDTMGVLEVCLDACEITADMAAVSLPLKPGPYLRLTVRDTGHGMPPEVVEHIFEPFFTTKDAGEGTGLGLAVAHGIVASHGGAITVASTPEQGTTFEVYLPRSDQAVAAAVGPEEPIPTGSECILFVDDENTLARVGQAALVRLGYKVVIHTSSLAALEAFRAAPERFDLVITDYTMPHMTGESLARELRRIRPDIPIILCTGFSHTMTAEKAKALGIDAFCMKPLLFRDLGLVIRQVLVQRAAHQG